LMMASLLSVCCANITGTNSRHKPAKSNLRMTGSPRFEDRSEAEGRTIEMIHRNGSIGKKNCGAWSAMPPLVKQYLHANKSGAAEGVIMIFCSAGELLLASPEPTVRRKRTMEINQWNGSIGKKIAIADWNKQKTAAALSHGAAAVRDANSVFPA
jgi:hypothetical protein